LRARPSAPLAGHARIEEAGVKDFRAPHEDEAAERAWRVARAAYQSREPVTWPRRHARPLIAGAVVAAAAAAVLSPPGLSVVHSLRKAVGVENAETELFSLPAPGRLLVSGKGGAWLVNADGSRRRLGAYRDAAWSPHGLFIVAVRRNELVALDPKGNVRWSLPRRSPRFPTWTGTFTDTRIAYIAGGRLHVVAGDGTGDRVMGPASRVAPAWRPGPGHVVAYATRGKAVVYDVDAGRTVLAIPATTVKKLAWSDDRHLLVFGGGVRVYDRRGRLRYETSPSELTHYADAAFVPGTHRLLIIDVHGSESDVFTWRNGNVVFRGSGVFERLAFSPGGQWLLVTWPTANQWVFVRAKPRKIVGASRISAQFGGFPTTASWCCGH
jgi:hypothetical protein